MNKIIFGGTSEGRKLCEFCASHNLSVLYFSATADGARCAAHLPNVQTRTGRLDEDMMTDLFVRQKPAFVVDATHPYAVLASKNIKAACERAGIRLIRVSREREKIQNCVFFRDMSGMLEWLENQKGNIFVTTGVSKAAEFAKLTDYQNRVWMRILPNINSLSICLEAGYNPRRLICMQGPFSEELNRVMFLEANARVLVTKDSGAAGGFPEKVRAAQKLGITTAVLLRPEDDGLCFDEACKLILELSV
ncbi:MAG: precorrin-6A reductase [Clostridiales bacterium]|nr:precorrin-6A reductase [Clostridiales bacterium]